MLFSSVLQLHILARGVVQHLAKLSGHLDCHDDHTLDVNAEFVEFAVQVVQNRNIELTLQIPNPVHFVLSH